MGSNPRVYIVIATFLPLVGGAEKQCLAQAYQLRERGFEATIITFRHDKAWSRSEVIEGIPVVRIAGILLGRREQLPKQARQLLYLLALIVMGWTLWQHRWRYDVLHVHQLTLLALPTALACWLANKPMCIVVHSAGTGKIAGSHDKESLIVGPLDPNLPWLQIEKQPQLGGDLENLERLGNPVVRFTRSLLRRIGAIVIVISSRMKTYLAEHDFNLPDVQLIPNGVDITRFTPTCADPLSDERAQVVICVSSLRYIKGIDVLLQAWHLVCEQVPQARLILVGTGPLQAQLAYMAKALDITESIEFAGLQSNIPAQLQRGSIAVLPSRAEGMPVALLEAMACGLPCVATRVSGSEDIIQHGVNGLLVEPLDYQGMAQALLALLGDPMLVQSHGHAARATIEQRYSLEHIADMYIELYDSLIPGGSTHERGSYRAPISSGRPQFPLTRGEKHR